MSDKTPWRDLEEKGIGRDISLENEEKFVAVIDALKVGKPTRDGYRSRCVDFAGRVLNDDNALEANRRLFLTE